METSKSVIFPNEMLDEMEIEDTFFPTNSNSVGIAVLSDFQDSVHIMRIYQLLLNKKILVRLNPYRSWHHSLLLLGSILMIFLKCYQI